MRYEQKRNYPYPLLRPGSDDYPAGNLHTEVLGGRPKIQAEIQELQTAVVFHLDEPYMDKMVAQGQAICAVMLYCARTLYRRVYKGSVEPRVVNIGAPINQVIDLLELHPFIVAAEELVLQGEMLHPEYGEQSFTVQPWQPLAFDQTWRFKLNPPVAPIRAIFDLGTDDRLPDHQFSVELGEQYIRIFANEKTRQVFEIQRDHRALTHPSVYFGALMQALATIKNEAGLEEAADPLWKKSIRSKLEALELDIGTAEEDGEHNLFAAAQRLLHLPFRYITQRDDHYEDDFEGEE